MGEDTKGGAMPEGRQKPIYADPYWDYEENDCWNCSGEGFVTGCSWDWQCDTYDAGEGTCLCTRRCDVCQPRKPNPELQQALADAPALPLNPSPQESTR